MPYTPPAKHLDLAMKGLVKAIKTSRILGKRTRQTSLLQEVHDHLEAVGDRLRDLTPAAHPEWEGFTPEEIGYLLRNVRYAALLLRGDYRLYAEGCTATEGGSCEGQHTLVALASWAEAQKLLADRLAPVFYGVPAAYADSHSLGEINTYLEADINDCIWFGDTSRDGKCICGLLLHYLVASPSVPFS